MCAERFFEPTFGVPAEDDDGAAAELLHGCVQADALLCKVVLSERGAEVISPEAWATVINGGHVEIAQLFVHAHSCLRSSQVQSRSPLELAAEQGHNEVCEYLLQATKAHECCYCQWSMPEVQSNSLIAAAKQGHVAVCQTLVTGSANDQLLTKAVRVASEHGHLQVRDSLLQCLGHDLKTLGSDGRMALHRAAELGHVDICRLLVHDAGCQGRADGQGSTPLHLAAEQGHRQVIEVLLEGQGQAQQGQGQGQGLQRQNTQGQATATAAAAAAVADPRGVADSDGRLPLHRAAEQGHAEVCRLLLTRPTPFPCLRPGQEQGQEQGRQAGTGNDKVGQGQGQGRGQTDLQGLGRADSHGWTPLHIAAASGHVKTCEVLLELRAQAELVAQAQRGQSRRGGLRRRGQTQAGQGQPLPLPLPPPVPPSPSPDKSDGNGSSASCSASALVSVSVSTPTSAFSTPLHVAAGQGHVEVCELLLQRDRSSRHGHEQAHCQSQGSQGQRPTSAPPSAPATPSAESQPDPHVLKLLHARDARARTPLHESAEAGHLQTCQLLVNHGALLQAVSRDGTPMACAERSETAEAAEVAAYLKTQIESIWGMRGGSGEAWRAAITDQRDVFEIEWHCKLLPGPMGLLGGRHSAIVAWMDASGGSGAGFLTAYCIEKAQPEKVGATTPTEDDNGDDAKDAPHCPNGVFVSSWLETQGAFEEKRHVLPNRHLQRRIRLAELRDLAIALGPYDPIKCNCHHAAMALYNRCAAAEHLQVHHSPCHVLDGIACLVPASFQGFFATTQTKPTATTTPTLASLPSSASASTSSCMSNSVSTSSPDSEEFGQEGYGYGIATATASASLSEPDMATPRTMTPRPQARIRIPLPHPPPLHPLPSLPLPPVLSCGEEVTFRGRVLMQEGVECVASLPGKFASAWTALTQTKTQDAGMDSGMGTGLSMACVFMRSPLDGLGQHALDPEHPGDCYCRTIYGDRGGGAVPGREQGWHRLGYLLTYPSGDLQKERRQREKARYCQAAVVAQQADPATQRMAEVEAEERYEENERRASWGCAWFHRWKVNIELARKSHQKLIVYYFPFQVGLGEVPWEELKNPDVNLWDDLGLGGSQKCEVAHLERMGYPYEKRDVRTLLTRLR